jgi:hypothetical protein
MCLFAKKGRSRNFRPLEFRLSAAIGIKAFSAVDRANLPVLFFAAVSG